MTKVDLHIHTKYSPDADPKGEMNFYCEQALKSKTEIICFTDHVDVYGLGQTLSFINFSKRYDDFVKTKEQYKDRLTVLLGLEYGEPNYDFSLFKKITEDLPYDFILGSVHNPMEMFWAHLCSADTMIEEHYSHTLKMTEKGGFDSLAHLDFPKKFTDKWQADWEKTRIILQNIIKADISLEINTSTLRRGQAQCCPSQDILELYYLLGGKFVTIGSDSHEFSTVGSDFEGVVAAIPQGLKVCYYKNRKRVVL